MLIVAHGSRDPRHAATVSALAARVRSLAPAPRVAVGFLEFSVPGVGPALDRLRAAGEREVVVLPLLLSSAYHAKTDIPAVLAEQAARLPGMAVRQAEVLGPSRARTPGSWRPDPWSGPGAAALLLAALERRLAEAGPMPADRSDTGVVLASAGTSDPAAVAVIEELAEAWRRAAGWCAVRPAFASASPPRTADAVRALRADGARRVVVAPYVIAPGRLPDRIAAGAREAAADLITPVLGSAPELVRLLRHRYEVAAGACDGRRLAG